jgi:uncharacterized protein (DUF433 family)
MDWRQYISIEPNRRNGKPCIVGTRITVQDVLEYLAGGSTEQELLEEFPQLRLEHVQACFAFAAEAQKRTVPAGL